MLENNRSSFHIADAVFFLGCYALSLFINLFLGFGKIAFGNFVIYSIAFCIFEIIKLIFIQNKILRFFFL